MKKIRIWLTTSIAGIIILGLSTNSLYDILKNIPILGVISKFLNNLRVSVNQLLFLEVKLWKVIVFVGLILVTFSIVKWVLTNKNDSTLTFWDYKKDGFKNWIWKWDYNQIGEIVSLTPYCRDCDVRLMARNNEFKSSNPLATAQCPFCAKEWKQPTVLKTGYSITNPEPTVEFLDETKALILSNIEKMQGK